MLMLIFIVILLQDFPIGESLFHTCIPHTQFHVNGRLCICDSIGRWSETSCEASRRQTCKPGQIVWEDCSQCICQENGHMLCTNNMCTEDTAAKKSNPIGRTIDVKRLWCIPFMSYYVNCSLCVCPVSGKMNEARCATDATCPFVGITDHVTAVKNNVCIPKVIYLFPCLHCLCSDEGFFIVNKCVETCQKSVPDVARRCIPKTFYRKDCNVCFCPDSSVTNDKLCTKSICGHQVTLEPLASLRNKTRRCHRQSFTGRHCIYCECNQEGKINEHACIDAECMTIHNFDYNFLKTSCSIGEMVPRCMECLCLKNDMTDTNYCTNECRDVSKLAILETAIKDSFKNNQILDRKAIRKTETSEVCEPNSVYNEEGRYCFCPENGATNFNLCTAAFEDRHVEKTKIKIRGNTVVDIDFNVNCEPNTFVEFDCNTCYCVKNGRIDPKWCTYDDCESKRIIMERHKIQKQEPVPTNGACSPGSISKDECNFCICSESGQLKDRACTKNKCTGITTKGNNVLACEPLTYYTVDCNICYCPKNGIKNVAKCTRNTCEKTFLRTEVCVPGRLFSEECNVCVCPPNGDKSDRVCTNNTCTDSDTPWKKIFQLSQSLMSYQKMGETTRNLELCFPGEEFEMGCKVCLCSDMGLRHYATCTQMLCDEEKDNEEMTSDFEKPSLRTRRSQGEPDCDLDADDDSTPMKKCTPGSTYIIKCEECICPYMGNIKYFCRPLPNNFYCEQAFPGVNYLPSRRETEKNTTALSNTSTTAPSTTPGPHPPHAHTTWTCSTPGRLTDSCYICDCNAGVVIQEHCFKNKNSECANATRPTFLKNIKLPERYIFYIFINLRECFHELMVILYMNLRLTNWPDIRILSCYLIYGMIRIRKLNHYATFICRYIQRHCTSHKCTT